MRRLLVVLIMLAVLGLALSVVSAQSTSGLQRGDPPDATRITVSVPNEQGQVTVAGSNGSVFPGAQVAVRNLYTGDTAYAQAGLAGSFSATLYGPGNTPFWISPAVSIPAALQNRPGSLPGGPGTIVYGPFPQTPLVRGPISQLIVDGDLTDWDAYRDRALVVEGEQELLALANQDSIYLALADASPLAVDGTRLALYFRLDGVTYSLALDPRLPQPAILGRLDPNPLSNLSTVSVAAVKAAGVELRLPRVLGDPNLPSLTRASLLRVVVLAPDGAEIVSLDVNSQLPVVNESDGIVRLSTQLGGEFARFTISGRVAGGAGRWSARGRVSTLDLQPGQQLVIELDVDMTGVAVPTGLVGLRMLGRLRLQPVVGPDGWQTAGGPDSNNGWSDILTSSGMPVINRRGDFMFAETSVDAARVIRKGGRLLFPLDFVFAVPEDLPAGMYVPVFSGFGQVGDGDLFTWEDASLLGDGGDTTVPASLRLPFVLNVGAIESGRLLWTLFQDSSSNGSRGLLSVEDRQRYGLSNRVHFDNPTFILPPSRGGEPITYPIEPYLLNQLANTYDRASVPLVPFLFPGGRLNGRVTRPDGEVDDLGSVAFIQGQMSTFAADERTVFGAQSPLDVFRLTTLNPAFTRYVFSQYGTYRIQLAGSLEDVWGNRYKGGGTYVLVVAEPLTIRPAVLSGTPFEVGDAFNPGLHVVPGSPAEITVTVQVFPLDGSPSLRRTFSGLANGSGVFQPADDPLRFDVPGEYVIDYEARFTDADGRLWAGSLRSAGVIGAPDRSLLAHGRRGLAGYSAAFRPSWFTVATYAPAGGGRLNFPYHAGDVVWVPDDRTGLIDPGITLQDTAGAYAAWLAATFPDYRSDSGESLARLAVKQELPVGRLSPADERFSGLVTAVTSDDAYAYVSAVGPGNVARQFVQGGLDGGLPLHWDMDDPYNGQAGAGLAGSRAGDFLFLFGGAIVRSPSSSVTDATIYGSLAVMIDPKSDGRGARVFPPFFGESGGASGGVLTRVRGRDVEMFFHPTAVRPGDVLHLGDTLSVGGQLAPLLPSHVEVTITSPSGAVRQFDGVANAIGYFYDPQHDFAVEESGIWTVRVRTYHEGLTSVGPVEPPPPSGDVLGTADGTFQVYVVPRDAESLAWNDNRADFAIPAAVPYNFNFPLPSDWTDIQVYHTVTIPGYVLDQGPLRASGRSFSYQYNATNISREFPMLESNGAGEGSSASDVVTLSFIALGRDADGVLQVRARAFTIAHDRLTTFG